MSRPSDNDLYRAAQILARQGQPVFPCRPVNDGNRKSKSPLTRNGLKDASDDPDQIKAWWSKHRGAAIGIPTGLKYDVLDVDVKRDEDGRLHLTRLTELGLLNGCKFVVRTPSGGWHLYFTAAPALTNKANKTLGLDVRALGGYVLAPGSYIEVDDEETQYAGTYDNIGPTVGGTDEPLFWDLIVSSLMPIDTDTKQPIMLLPSDRQSSLAALREWVSMREAGERNNALHWAVCRCIENGIDPHELMEAALLTGLEEHEILLTMNSALKRAGVLAEDLYTEAESLFGTD